MCSIEPCLYLYQSLKIASVPDMPDSRLTIVAYTECWWRFREELEDVADATSPNYDELRDAHVWWILEISFGRSAIKAPRMMG
jgi:hypothetical protein